MFHVKRPGRDAIARQPDERDDTAVLITLTARQR